MGLLIALIFKLGKNSHNNSLWGTLRSYGGLLLDGFLFPQIFLNVFKISRGNHFINSEHVEGWIVYYYYLFGVLMNLKTH